METKSRQDKGYMLATGVALRGILKINKTSGNGLARILGYDQSMVNLVLSGRNAISLARILAYSAAVGLFPFQLVYLIDHVYHEIKEEAKAHGLQELAQTTYKASEDSEFTGQYKAFQFNAHTAGPLATATLENPLTYN